MRGWCRSPPVGGGVVAAVQGRLGLGDTAVQELAGTRGLQWGQLPSHGQLLLASISHHSAGTGLAEPTEAAPLVMILGGGGWARGDTPCHGRAATSPASPNLQCQPSHCTIHHDTTVLCIFIYLEYISKIYIYG